MHCRVAAGYRVTGFDADNTHSSDDQVCAKWDSINPTPPAHSNVTVQMWLSPG